MLLLFVSLEIKSGDESLSSCSIHIVRFSGTVGKVLSCDYAGPGSILARKHFFLNIASIFIGPTRYQASLIVIHNMKNSYTWVGSTWESKINNFVYKGK